MTRAAPSRRWAATTASVITVGPAALRGRSRPAAGADAAAPPVWWRWNRTAPSHPRRIIRSEDGRTVKWAALSMTSRALAASAPGGRWRTSPWLLVAELAIGRRTGS